MPPLASQVEFLKSAGFGDVGALVANTGDNGLGPTQSTITWLGEPARDQRRFLGAYLFR